jgi:hypothetical protein
MNGSIDTTIGTASRQGRCSVEGCPCKDVRIVGRRRAAFFAALAHQRGQTANRVILSEADWALPR